MGWKGFYKAVVMILFAVGLPVLIFYSIFRTSPDEQPAAEDLTEIERRLQQDLHEDYQVHSVQADGSVLRVNIVLSEEPASSEALRMRTLDALYDVQDVVGKDRHSSVWTGSALPDGKLRFLGMAFYSSISENYVFKSAAEIR
ncbi:MAG: hypothetical protein HY645_12560 [Acidobacteria bacterium]|nr:hypothetical protein [Acidobacteriota bacterium]